MLCLSGLQQIDIKWNCGHSFYIEIFPGTFQHISACQSAISSVCEGCGEHLGSELKPARLSLQTPSSPSSAETSGQIHAQEAGLGHEGFSKVTEKLSSFFWKAWFFFAGELSHSLTAGSGRSLWPAVSLSQRRQRRLTNSSTSWTASGRTSTLLPSPAVPPARWRPPPVLLPTLKMFKWENYCWGNSPSTGRPTESDWDSFIDFIQTLGWMQIFTWNKIFKDSEFNSSM